jgi:hypothetical protein
VRKYLLFSYGMGSGIVTRSKDVLSEGRVAEAFSPNWFGCYYTEEEI